MSNDTYTYTTTAIRTYTGRRFDYKKAIDDDINVMDIAVQLSREPRWASATKQTFTVGQHSVLTCDHVADNGGTPVDQLLALMHDATEAYTKDIPRPLKNCLPGYKELENKIWDRICLKFFNQRVTLPSIVKLADGAMLNAEDRDLRAYYHSDDSTLRDIGQAMPYTKKIEPWPEATIILEFLSRFSMLYTKPVLSDPQWELLIAS